MERRDLIKDQIEELGRVLGKILADFLGLKSKGNVEQGMEVANERFQSQLDIDINQLINLSKDQLKEYVKDRGLTDSHLETLSDYLKEVGLGTSDSALNQVHLQKAIDLLDIADELTKTMSFERINKKSRLLNFLEQKG